MTRRSTRRPPLRFGWARAALFSGLGILGLGLAGLGLAGCGDGGGTFTITDVRERERPLQIIPSDVTSADRLIGRAREMTYAWDAPETWTKGDEKEGRLATYELPGTGKTSCVLSSLPGDAGGELANINRWRKQMDLDPTPSLRDESVEWMTLAGLGQQALGIDLQGTFSGMGADELGDSRMLVALIPRPGHTLFVKLLGAEAEVAAARTDFRALVQSLKCTGDKAPKEMMGHGGAGHGGAGHGGVAPPPKDTPVASKLTWTAPQGWASTRTPGAMRLGTLRPGKASPVECTIFVLLGDGGGLALNVNRWAEEQMNHAPFSAAELEKLDRLEVLGVSGYVVEIPGSYKGMGDEVIFEDALMLALICFVGEESVFVKMTGPKDEVAALKETFLELCRSLRLED